MKKFQRRRLAVAVAASVGLVGLANAAFEEVTEANPFDAITSTGENPSLVMMDLDNDGDKDAVLFHSYQNDNYHYNYGGTSVWENIGSATAPEFSHVPDTSYASDGNIAVSPFADDYDRYYGHPVSAADLEGDGDLDFFGGQDCAYSGYQLSYAEVESDESGIVTGVTQYEYNSSGYGSNPFYQNTLAPDSAYGSSGYGCGQSAFAAGDLDNDTDIDIVSVDQTVLRVFMNDGTDSAGTFMFNEQVGVSNPLLEASSLTSPYYGAPAVLHDVDADGDLDLVMGTVSAAPLRLFINEGTASTADFVEVEDTSGSLDVTSTGWAAPTFADMDGDGKDDLIVVELNMSEPELQPRQSERRISLEGSQSIRYFRNTSADDSVAAEESSSNGGSLGIAAVLMGMLFGLRRRRR